MTFAAAPVGGLDQPLYGASLGQAFKRFWKRYATFSGRAAAASTGGCSSSASSCLR